MTKLDSKITRMQGILLSHGIDMSVYACSCCNNPEIKFVYEGETILDDGKANFDTDDWSEARDAKARAWEPPPPDLRTPEERMADYYAQEDPSDRRQRLLVISQEQEARELARRDAILAVEKGIKQGRQIRREND